MNESIQWQDAVERVRPYIVRIVTPYGSGTGFVVSHSEAGDLFGVATAAHVVAQAHEWELPVRIEHELSGQTLVLHADKRAILIDGTHDSAGIVFEPQNVKLPSKPPVLIPEDKILKVGVEIGWLGYPALSPRDLCFFHGRVSAPFENESGYLVDGVAINGVSGGPALSLMYDTADYVGVVSAYFPNRATGEPLPGLALVRDVSYFHDLIKRFRSIDDARKQQTAPQDASPAPVPGTTTTKAP
ncbi:MAG: serine protease [Burkholderiales bacterium]